MAGVRPDPPGRPARPRPGHQARPVRCVRPGRRGHRGSGAHLGDAERHVELPEQVVTSATRCGSRSSTSTSSVAASRCRSSRPTTSRCGRGARSSTRTCTAWPPPSTTGQLHRTRTASTPRPASGRRASRRRAPSGSGEYAEAHARWEAHRKQSRGGRRGRGRGVRRDRLQSAATSGRPARWPATRRCRRCATSSPAATSTSTHHEPPLGPVLRRAGRRASGGYRGPMEHSAGVTVALTGGIGSGKTTVTDLLAARGAVVVDADEIARAVVEPGEPALHEIAAAFGPEVIGPDGSLRRQALAAIVFPDPQRLARLNAIMHPRIAERTGALLRAARRTRSWSTRCRCCGEGQAQRGWDLVVVVDAPEEVRLRRLVDRPRAVAGRCPGPDGRAGHSGGAQRGRRRRHRQQRGTRASPGPCRWSGCWERLTPGSGA